jgi:hypothetical protein
VNSFVIGPAVIKHTHVLFLNTTSFPCRFLDLGLTFLLASAYCTHARQSFPGAYVGLVECVPASPYTYSSSTDFGLWSCGFRGNVIVYRAHKEIQVEECRPRRRSWSRFPLTRSCPELFRGTGPLLSLVLRTEDVWQRYNHCVEVCGAFNQGFPFSPLQWRPMIVPCGD